MPDTKQEFVNTPMPTELVDMLDEMAQSKDQSRAAFIRQLIRKEYTYYIATVHEKTDAAFKVKKTVKQ